MSKTVVDWMTVIGTAATGPAALVATADHFPAKVIVGIVLSFLIGLAGAAKALYATKPGDPPKV